MISVDDFEVFARNRLAINVYEYYRSGANEEITLKENREAFKRLYLRPRMLRNVSKSNLKTTIQGEIVSFPIGVAPTAMQCMAHSDGEKATAHATAKLGTVMILSTLSTTSIEEIAKAEPNLIRWFQLYICKDKSITEKLILRAEKNGFKAIVLTVDAPIFGKRISDIKNNFILPPHLKLANFDDIIKPKAIGNSKNGSGINNYVRTIFDQSINWKDLTWIKSITSLPLIVKGILTAEDAVLAQKYGANGIIVSNHGGRQLDGVPATIEVLPEIVKAVGNSCEVYMDGGIRTGTDVLKCLAIGARFVFTGRPVIWGLAYKGQEGVQEVLEILKEELQQSMLLCGCSALKDIESRLVVPRHYYSKL